MLLVLCLATIATLAFSASHADDDLMVSGIRSPVGRHQLESWDHYNLMLVHDFGAFTSLAFFFVLWNINKTNPLHKILGRILAIPLLTAIVTGFMLIYVRKSETHIHIHAKELGRMTISTQGYSVIGICINSFILNRWWKGPKIHYALLLFHTFNVLMGLRSLWFLFSTYMQIGHYEANEINREVAFELLFALTLPQLAIDTWYTLLHIFFVSQPSTAELSVSDWRVFHEIGTVFLIYITSIGVVFNVAHDAYYIFTSPGITELWKRMIIIMSSVALVLYFKLTKMYEFGMRMFNIWYVAKMKSD